MKGALDGIKVLDFTHSLGGPFCTLMLKELGAEIIKIEKPLTGDVTRRREPQTAAHEGGTFIILNRGKKSITLNLRSEKGHEICVDLVKKVDVLVENFSPGTMDRLGLGSQELLKINPGLVYASMSAFGHTGPRSAEPGYDPVAQAMGGLTTLTGEPDGPPMKAGPPVADLGAGTFLSLAIVSALYHKKITGEGQVIDISMQDVIWLFTAVEFSPMYFIDCVVPHRYGNGVPHASPANVYKTSDGYIIIATAEFTQVKNVFKVIGREDLIDTPIVSQQNERLKRRLEIDAMVEEWTKTKTSEEVVAMLKAVDVPCSIVPTYDQVCNDPQLLSRNMVIEVEQALSGKVKTPGSLFKLTRTPGNLNYPAPRLGENNREIYSGTLGYSPADLDAFVKDGII